MSLYYVERQPWQRWPNKLIMVKQVDGGGKDERRAYVPERTCGEWRGSCGSVWEEDDLELWCEHCDMPLEVDWKHCPNCGAKVVGE